MQQHDLQETLSQVLDLLKKQELVSHLVRKQASPRQNLVESLVKKQQLAELEQKLQQLHPADTAFVLENLPLDKRQAVWQLLRPQCYGAILLEVSDAVRKSLIADMQRDALLSVTAYLSANQIADLVPDLPKDIAFDLLVSLDSHNRQQVQSALAFPEGTAGALMAFDMVTVREDVTLETVLNFLRREGQLPAQADQLFVVDQGGKLKGLLPLRTLLLNAPDALVKGVMQKHPIYFHTNDAAKAITQAFDRYDLISAPVVNVHHQLVGYLGVDEVMDFINEATQKERLTQVGLPEDEDLFAPLWNSAKNRWAWLALNLMTAFLASRVIGAFENTISQLVALATLMPIVASIGGNTGNQTVALIIRGLALQQINTRNVMHILLKEAGISLINGLIWGVVVGVFVLLLYQDLGLAGVMMLAMLLNLVVASLAGVFIPLGLQRMGRDPVMGSSVMLTAFTDSMGFFIFLGLASLWLLGN